LVRRDSRRESSSGRGCGPVPIKIAWGFILSAPPSIIFIFYHFHSISKKRSRWQTNCLYSYSPMHNLLNLSRPASSTILTLKAGLSNVSIPRSPSIVATLMLTISRCWRHCIQPHFLELCCSFRYASLRLCHVERMLMEEWNNRTLTNMFGDKYRGCYALAVMIFALGIVRDYLYALHIYNTDGKVRESSSKSACDDRIASACYKILWRSTLPHGKYICIVLNVGPRSYRNVSWFVPLYFYTVRID